MEESEKVGQNFEPDPVHDLRVALRRCRSMADAFAAVDPDPGWKQLKKLGKALFGRLGALRDMQVMEEWVNDLADPEDVVGRDILKSLAEQEAQLKADAETALRAFDINHWQSLSAKLALRTRKITLGGAVFQHMAVERWDHAHQLHRRALKNRSQVSFHELRIGLKKLRYVVENFLPKRHEKWGADLRELQDLLGQVHDLDVLQGILKSRPGLTASDRARWTAKIRAAREERLTKYRHKMAGRQSLWHQWREDLPQGDQLQQAALTRLQTWASFLDPNFAHSQHVSVLALQIYDGLVKNRLLRPAEKARRILQAAALLHDVGLAKARRKHQKRSCRLISGKLAVPLGWTSEDLRAVAAVARYHRGALPNPQHKCLKAISGAARAAIIRLAAILRLANGLDAERDGKVRRLEVERKDGFVILRAEGYTALGPTAERVSADRYLLEASCRVAVIVRPL